MKKKLCALLLCFLFYGGMLFAAVCCNDCGSGCISYCISYTTDCTNGEIQTFTAVHFHFNGVLEFSSDETNPWGVGMDAGRLGCDPMLCI